MDFEKKLKKSSKKEEKITQKKQIHKEEKIRTLKSNISKPKDLKVLQIKSKRIKKLQKPVLTKQKQIQTAYTMDYNEFYNTKQLTLQKIKARTIKNLVLDKNLIKTATKSLKTHYNNQNTKKNDLLDNQDDFIYLEINLAKVPETYSIRPVQM